MKILVTGHEGFIGKHVFAHLETCGHDVIGYDRISGHDIRFLDRRDLHDGVGAIVHLAAVADISSNWDSTENRDAVWSHNVEGTNALLEAYPRVPFIFASTGAVYGRRHHAQEDMACWPNSVYGASKVAAEALLSAWGARFGVRHSVLRLSCVIGGGYTHWHVKDFVDQMYTKGVLRPKTNGQAKRSHVHVEDIGPLCNALAVGKIDPGTYNVASGTWACRDTIREMGLHESQVVYPGWREGWDGETGWTGDNHVVLSTSKLLSQGWRPTKGVAEGCKDALASLEWKR